MTVSLDGADQYFLSHKMKEIWINAAYDDLENLLVLAELYIKNSFSLREATEETTNYEHAIYEQAIHLLSFDKERYKLQTEGVKSYSFDGISTQMEQSIISPISYLLLKKYICRKVGDIK